MKSVMTILGMSFLIAASIQAQAPVPAGDQFQVNSYTTSYQGNYGSDVAMAGSGEFIVVWSSNGSSGSDTSDYSIQGQRFAADGSPQGSEFQVNSYTTNTQQYSVMGVGPDGDFVVVWQSSGSNGTDTGTSIQGQRFDGIGSPQGSEFQVNSYTTSGQIMPAMAVGPGGEFVVVWSSFGSYSTDTSYYSIQGRRFTADGSPQGGDFQVNTYTNASQWWPDVAVGPAGEFVVVWVSLLSSASDTSGYSIRGRRFAADGSPQGLDFQVNSYTTGSQSSPDVAVGQSGDFVVMWNSPGSSGTDTSSNSIQAQHFAASGSPRGGEFQVNTYTTGSQWGPSVTANIQGDFVVVWRSEGSDGTDTNYASIQGQRLAANGSALGDEFQVNSYTTGSQFGPAVSANAEGHFVVAWASNGSDGTDTSYSSIQGQRMIISVIFTDSFESGDTSAWSKTVQ